MTMQIAVPARNNGFVLVSDTKALRYVGEQQPAVPTYESRISIAARHQRKISPVPNLVTQTQFGI